MRRNTAKIDRVLNEATQHWKFISPILSYPKNDAEYDVLVSHLDNLLDIVGSNEKHALIGLVDAISHLISSYDEKNFSLTKLKGIDALKYLMELKEFTQNDLRAIGSQGVVSEILSGKRKLNLRQIKILAAIFHVSPATFIDC